MKVIKRNGEEVPFCKAKIASAITRANDELAQSNLKDTISDDDINLIATRLYERCKKRPRATTVEEIQDMVETELMKIGAYELAKIYIRYRDQREKVRNANETLLNYKKVVDDYLNVADWRVKENSTVSYSVGGLILSNSGAVTANYWLSEVYDEEIAKAHKNADIHIHDLSMLTGYCFTGGTRIRTPDGKSPTFKELVDKNVRELKVFAYDRRIDAEVVALAIYPRITRRTKNIQKTILSYGGTVMSTPDHRFMLEDGSYTEAFNLKPGDELKGFGGLNDSVKEIQNVELDEEIELYDLTVPGYQNFLLDCGIYVHNCAGWSLKQLIQEGLGGVPGKITSSPAKHLSTLCNQMVNFLGILQNEWAGAQAFSSFDTYLAPFVKVDNLPYSEIKQCLQSFIFGVNVSSRWGSQAPFTNVTFDWIVPNDLAELNAIVGGKEMDFKYKDCQKEMDMINKAFIEIFLEGDANGRGFQLNLVA